MTLPTIPTLTSVHHSTIRCLSSYHRISTTRQTSTINYFLPQLSMPTKQIFLKQFSKIISFIVFSPSVGRELPHIQFQLESAATTAGLKTISDFTPLESILKFETHIGGYFWRRPTHFEASSRHDNQIFSGSCNIFDNPQHESSGHIFVYRLFLFGNFLQNTMSIGIQKINCSFLSRICSEQTHYS